MKVEVLNLTKHFGATHAVNDVSFSFASGQVVGFVGPNGAGKTTTMRILATLDEPTSGEALIDGVSVVEEPERARQLVGYVPDSLPTHRDISVHEYLDFFARAYGLKGSRREQTVESIEEFTNLAGIREKMLMALSKGMKQRVTLARALLHDPPVLILDEPAAGLDPRARIELRELLRALSAQGKAILISSHILTELAEICDGAIIIEHGKILMAGGISDLLTDNVPRRTVLIRVLERQEELHRDLLQMPHIESVRLTGSEIAAELSGADETCSDVLAAIVARGYRVVEFKQQRANLEELFMNVTRGVVQ
ncbi:MAG TPA: ABC transporter ATP-binding protein [Blastocatellia bacterium]|nr:ABC transporter ATP-binding protein [Blastocatellia bacterium]HMV83061.1 ABC transporter ATP-binding protein [Blastocatellia bacterium]HMZ17750.1 ABC transporter ATP-binding protein [Blastocatellia bacterium]HNG33773.1 ABC transporter ATP-binding protein [Blastocatellia bacterium]